MNPVLAFTIIMLIWTVSDLVSKKTKSLLSSLFVASIIFLIGFKTNIMPPDILTSSSLLALGTTILGFVIVHIGTMISIKELKSQWKTVFVGVSAILGITTFLLVFGPLFESRNYAIAAIAAVSGGTVSILLVQEAALAIGLVSVAVLPVLISAFQGLIGFPITAVILKKEAERVRDEYRNGTLVIEEVDETKDKGNTTMLPDFLQTTAGTLFVVGVVNLTASYLSGLTGGVVNNFIIALLLGVALSEMGVLKSSILSGIDAYGLMMLAMMIVIFGPLSTISVDDLIELIIPLILSFLVGVTGSMVFATIAGKIVKYSPMMAIAVGLTSLFGFPGTMILSQDAAKNVGETEEEIKVIEDQILPKMVIAGFSTVTITSVLVTGIIVAFIR